MGKWVLVGGALLLVTSLLLVLWQFDALRVLFPQRPSLPLPAAPTPVSSSVSPPVAKGGLTQLLVQTPGSVTVVSDIATVSAQLTNGDWLMERLQEVTFWGNQRIALLKPSGFQTKRITVRSLVVHLTDQPQPLGQTYSADAKGTKGDMYQSFGMRYDATNGQLDLVLFVHPRLIQSDPVGSLASRFSGLFLFAVFNITHPLLPQHKSFEERLVGLDDFVRKINEAPNITVFLLRK